MEGDHQRPGGANGCAHTDWDRAGFPGGTVEGERTVEALKWTALSRPLSEADLDSLGVFEDVHHRFLPLSGS